MRKIISAMITLLCISFGMIEVEAADYSTEFQKLTSDGTITISVKNLNSKETLVLEHIGLYDTDNYTFILDSCNDDYTLCTIKGSDSSGATEQHEVTITYQEVYSEEFQKLAPNGKLVVTQTAFNEDNSQFIINDIGVFNSLNGTSYGVESCNEDSTSCVIGGNHIDGYYEQHNVEIVYEEAYSDIYKTLTSDGTITIPVYNLSNKDMLIHEYISQYNTANSTFYMQECNEDYTFCNIYVVDSNGNLEYHNVTINYKEEYTDVYKKFIKDDTLTITNSVVGSNLMLLDDKINQYNAANNASFFVGNCNEDYTTCVIGYEHTDRSPEEHEVTIIYQEEYSKEFQKLIDASPIKITSTNLDENKNTLIWEYLHLYNTENNTSFSLDFCNEDYTTCTIRNGDTEKHKVEIIFQEEYGDIFKQYINDDNLVIISSTLGEKRHLVDNYVNSFNVEGYNFYTSGCNEDSTVCNIVLQKVEINAEMYLLTEIERHNVKITYQEEYSENFKKLTTADSLTIKSVKPTTIEEAEFFISAYLSKYNHDEYYFYSGDCNEDYSMCDIYLAKGYSAVETHTLNINYSDVDQQILEQVNSLIDALPEGKRFIVEDLEIINYIVNSGYNRYNSNIDIENAVINYSSEIKNYFGNMTAKLDARAGWAGPFNSGAFGGFEVLYEDTVYGLLKDGGAENKYVIYVPDDTENTQEAYIKAAQTRINNYLKHDKVKIKYGGKLSEDFGTEAVTDIVDASTIRDEYYILTYEDSEFTFLIAKDSSKIKENVTYSTNDIMTDISISSESSSIPLDTAVQVNEIEKEDKKYQEYTLKLGVEDALMFDLKLYSYTSSQYISKLDDGVFMVKIPLPERFKDKKLAAYYIHPDGTVETYEVTVEDGYAIFYTTHFSIYTIAEASASTSVPSIGEEVPNTYDGISNYIALAIISFMMLASSVYCLRDKKSN